MDTMNHIRRAYIILFVVSILTSGASVVYFSILVRQANNPIANTYPVSQGADAHEYGTLAKNMVEHGVFSQSLSVPFIPDTNRTPGYPLFLAFFYKIFGSFYPVLIAQVFIVFLTSVLIFKIGQQLVGDTWSLVVAIVYMFDPNTFNGASIAMTETLFVLIFLYILYLLFFSQMKNAYLKWGISGLLLAIAAYVRPVAIYLPIVIILGYFLFYYKKSLDPLRKQLVCIGIFLIAFFVVIFPWYVRNKEVSGVWGFCSISAYNLFNYDASIFQASMTHQNVGDVRQELLTRAGLTDESMTKDLRYSSVMEKVAFQVIFSDPIHYGLYRVGTTVSFFVSSGLHQYLQFTKDLVGNYARKPEPPLSQALATMSLPILIEVIENHGPLLLENLFWLIVTLTLFLGVWRSKNTQVSRLFVLIVLYFAITCPLSANARYRVPITPLMMLGSALTIQYFYEKYKSRPNKEATATDTNLG
jgi:4-amino-4-deoxy-L-arabinose transferase-like glycosyltransferase